MTGMATAAGKRVNTPEWPFPKAWGHPPTGATEAQLAGWARGNIAWGRALQATGVEVRWLSKTQGVEARARLETPPAVAARLRQLQLHAKHRPPWMHDA